MARSKIGLVPQEIATDSFEKVINTLKFSRGLFNKPQSKVHLEKILKQLSLYDKKDQQLRSLSGGMKRRVMIAKALSHEPQILFLDEPTAGVDVELRKELWKTLTQLKKNGITIFLTTHYIEEAEKIADRVGIINDGKIIVIEEKRKLMKRLGKKTLTLRLKNENSNLIKIIKKYDIKRHNNKLIISFNENNKDISPSNLIKELTKNSIFFDDIEIKKTNLEQIFLGLIEK